MVIGSMSTSRVSETVQVSRRRGRDEVGPGDSWVRIWCGIGLGVQEKVKLVSGEISGSMTCSRHCPQQPKRRQYYKNGGNVFEN